jgi:hypothetical protein
MLEDVKEKEGKMELLIQGAVNGSWPAAVALGVMCLCIPLAIGAFLWGLGKITG